MHSDTSTTPDAAGQDTPKDGDQVAVVCRLPSDEHRRFVTAAERHGAGSTAGQVRVLIRDWMRSLPGSHAEDLAA